MKKENGVIMVMLLLVLLGLSYLIYRPHCNPESGCEPKRGSGQGYSVTPSAVSAPGPKGKLCYETLFNPATVIDVQGTVKSIALNPGFPPVLRMELETEKGMVPVLLSPERYLKEKNFSIKAGNRIVVHGSKMNYEKRDILVAGAMKKDGQSLAFRDEQGSILWNKGNKGSKGCGP